MQLLRPFPANLIQPYSYGGIFEHGSREYTLDDFYSLRLDKLDKYTCLKPCDVVVPKEGDIIQSSSDDDDDDDDDDESDEYDNEGENIDSDDVNMKATDIKEKEVVVAEVDDGDNEADEPEVCYWSLFQSFFFLHMTRTTSGHKHRCLWVSPRTPRVQLRT